MECIEHTGYVGTNGYGQRKYKGKAVSAHRLVYAQHHGLDLATMGGVVLHSCDNPTCVNPEHLSLGTQQSNTADRVAKDRSDAKVSLADAAYIRDNWVKGKGGNSRVLAAKFGISISNVGLIGRGKQRVGQL